MFIYILTIRLKEVMFFLGSHTRYIRQYLNSLGMLFKLMLFCVMALSFEVILWFLIELALFTMLFMPQ